MKFNLLVIFLFCGLLVTFVACDNQSDNEEGYESGVEEDDDAMDEQSSEIDEQVLSRHARDLVEQMDVAESKVGGVGGGAAAGFKGGKVRICLIVGRKYSLGPTRKRNWILIWFFD